MLSCSVHNEETNTDSVNEWLRTANEVTPSKSMTSNDTYKTLLVVNKVSMLI